MFTKKNEVYRDLFIGKICNCTRETPNYERNSREARKKLLQGKVVNLIKVVEVSYVLHLPQ